MPIDKVLSVSIANAAINASAISNTANLVIGALNTGNTRITGTQFVNGAVTFANSTGNTIYFAANGNINVGRVPSDWSTAFYTLGVGKGTICGTGSNFLQITTNSFYDGTNYRRIANGYASRLVLDGDNGGLYLETADTGGINNTFTHSTQLYITGTGNVGIGTTTSLTAKATINGNVDIGANWGSSGATLHLTNDSTSTNGSKIRSSYWGAGGYGPLIISTGGSDRVLVSNTGRFGIGTVLQGGTADPKSSLHVRNGGIMFNGMGTNTSTTYDNNWTAFLCSGVAGNYSGTITITIPDCNNGAGSTGYGSWSAEVYVSGYSGQFCHYFCSGYVNGGVTNAESTIRNSSGGWSASYTVNGVQGVTITIDNPTLTHPSAYVRFTKGGDPQGNIWTDIGNARITWS